MPTLANIQNDLIGSGFAPLQAQVLTTGNRLALLSTDTANNPTGLAGVRSAGMAFPAPVLARDINVHNMLLAEPLVTLDLPSPYFPSITLRKEHAYGHAIYFPNGWSGWRFWMVGAPYPASAGENAPAGAAKYENPCIYVSNDGETWVVPTGMTNPIATSIGLSDTNSYYADPMICANADNTKLYVIWMWTNQSAGAVKSSFFISDSSDGVTWSTPVEILQSTSATFIPNTPSLFWNGNGWTIFSIDTASGTFRPMYTTTTSATPYTGWAAPGSALSGAVPAVWTASVMPHPLSRNWWHGTVTRLKDDVVVGFMVDNNSAGGSGYTVKSNDGCKTFSVQPFTATNTAVAAGTFYRGSICVCNSGVAPDAILFLSRQGHLDKTPAGFHIQKARVTFGRLTNQSQREFYRNAVNAKLTGPLNVLEQSLLAWDSFQRVDSAVTLGNTETTRWDGATTAWTTSSGTVGISTNRAYGVGTGNNIATTDLRSSDYEFEFAIDTLGSQLNVVFGFVDTGNFYRWQLVNSNVDRVFSGGVNRTYGQTTFTVPVAGDVVRVRKEGNFITLFFNDRIVDGFALLDANDATLKVATKVGFQCSGASLSYIKNFWAQVPA
jgi:hypothetical protein